MTATRFIAASLKHYRQVHLAVALGVAVATAVLTGALLVGDSVRGSLRDLTIQRLGRIDSALVAPHLFRAKLVDELAADADFQKHFTAAEPTLLTAGTLHSGTGSYRRRATGITVIGTQPSFWELGSGGPEKQLALDEVAITEPLARELGVEVGGEVVLRIPVAGEVPADSPLGEKSDTSVGRRFTVASILSPIGLSRFGLVPSQHLPRNLFVSLETLQALLGKPATANAILAATDEPYQASSAGARQALERALDPQLQDFGVRIEHVSTPTDYWQITADQLVLPDEIVRAAKRAFQHEPLQPAITYLANTISVGEVAAQRKIPYSIITGIESTAGLGPLLDEASQPIKLADDEIALNRWAADDLDAEIGDEISVSFYEPESTHGELREQEPPAVFTLRAIVDLEVAEGGPTPAADPHLTPELPGVTDQQSISDWDLPFELVETIRSQDEDYWDEYRTTPKAFVSLATAKRLWPSRWGTISLLRLPINESLRDTTANLEETRRKMAERLTREIDPAELGMTFQAVKRLGLKAASGTTPFDALFLGFSFFLIAAALMLIALLFQLGVQQRASELGTLAAVGFDKRRIGRLLGREGLVVAAIGAALGVALGVVYAWAMITGLRTWWVAAIATPFLELHVTGRSIASGGLLGLAASWITIRWYIARLVRQPAAQLLAGTTAGEPRSPGPRRRAFWPILRIVLLLSIFILVAAAFSISGEAQAGAFFGSGAATLVLLLGEVRYRLRQSHRTHTTTPSFTMLRLSALNTARNPARSTLTIGLVAAASFLIIAISAFRLDTGESGTGGFDLLATSDLPIHYDLNTPEGRLELGFSDRADEQMQSWRVFSLRASGGEDASCLNLYRPTQPRVLGLPETFIDRGGFDFASSLKQNGGNAWASLHVDVGDDERGKSVVPVILDANTATYSLHLSGIGSRLTIRDGADRPVTLEVVGLLKNSVLQGNLLLSEANFLRLFPDFNGYRFFLIESNPNSIAANPSQIAGPPRGPDSAEQNLPANGQTSTASANEIAPLLESTLGDTGFDAVDAREQLAAYLAVQNTYLSTFQSLGALGLLLGTVGLAAVQLRSVLERRGELALMRAGGFRRRRLMRMVVGENAVLLVGGLAVGCAAAVVALIPQWGLRQTDVPWFSLAILLTVIATVGIFAGWFATRSALNAPILPTLRGD